MPRMHCGLEVRFATEAADGTFTGYGAVFGKVDDYGDVIKPGAFKATLAQAQSSGNWPALLLEHGSPLGGSDVPLGIWTSMEEDAKGLAVEGKLALDTRRGAEVYALLRMQPRPAITGLSIGFRAVDFTMGQKSGEPRRTLNAVNLFEVSLVTTPAQTFARVNGVKSAPTERDFESWLVRDAGFSSREAKQIIANGFKSLPAARDAGGRDDEGVVETLTRLEQLLRA